MTAPWRARVDALFDEALSLPEQQRTDFLDRRCDGDGALRADVEELLRLANQSAPRLEPGGFADSLLSALRDLADATTPAEPVAGQTIGAWRVVREIGRGGMGMVYLVQRADGQFDQAGALKVVRSLNGSNEAPRRLKRERRILASMTHANIARLLDGGQLEDGRPFFVMEYVEGRPIDRFSDEKRLTIDERLDLFVRVCIGVQYAHRQLVVHRDLKPSNIVVTAESEVKLLDFGIARLLSASEGRDDDALTQPLVRILTPEYASPEQVRGEPIAIASDVYQLGLLLYELLTGHRAQTITDASAGALERAVCEAAPVRPSLRAASAAPAVCSARRQSTASLVRKLRGDLDTIVLCALRKEPDRRYASVDELLDDVQRYRQRLPVRAQIDSPAYRMRKFAARHRVALGWGAAAVAASAVVMPAWTGQRWRAAREAARAEQVEKAIGDLFALPNPRVTPRQPMAVNYLDHAAHLVQTELAGQTRSQGRLLTLLGRSYNALGHYEPSIAVLQRALALREADFGPESAEVAETLEWLGQSQHYAGRYDPAEGSVRRALAIRQLRFGRDDPDTIRTTLELADLLHTRGNLLDAERALRETVMTLRKVAVAPRAEDFGHDSLPRAIRDLANVLRDRGLLDESAALYREAISAFHQLHGAPNQQAATSEVYFSRLLIMRSEFDAADAMLARTIPTLRRIYDGDHALVGIALRNLGYLRIEQGRLDEAAVVLEEAQRIQQRWLGPGHSMISRARTHQAELALRRGRPAGAVPLARQALGEFDELAMADHPSAIDARGTLGEALLALGQLNGAARELREALGRAERQFVAGDRRILRIREALARATAESRGATSP